MHLFKFGSVIIAMCLLVGFSTTLSAQQSLTELDSYTWKEKSAALESLATLQSQKPEPESLTSVRSAQPQDDADFYQRLYTKVSVKITDNVAIKTAIIDGFNETVSELSSASVSEDAQQKALEILIVNLRD